MTELCEVGKILKARLERERVNSDQGPVGKELFEIAQGNLDTHVAHCEICNPDAVLDF
jgi:hypothetical protein